MNLLQGIDLNGPRALRASFLHHLIGSSWTSLLFVGLIAMGATFLSACGGGGGGAGPVIQPPPVDPVDPPTSAYSAGPYAINGIDRIPQNMVKLTRKEMQRKFVIEGHTQSHEQRVGRIACESYIQSGDCDSQAGRIRYWDGTVKTEVGTSPFIKIVGDHYTNRPGRLLKREDWAMMDRDAITALFEQLPPSENREGLERSYWAALERGDQDNAYGLAAYAAVAHAVHLGNQWIMDEIARMPEVKIVNRSQAPDAFSIGDGNLPYLVINGAGNGGGNAPWYDDLMSAADKVKFERAIMEDRLIFVGGWDRDANGNYVRHQDSDSCRGDGIREGCVWAQYRFGDRGGTSYSSPQFAAALASVLAIAPDTTPENLARFGKACVKKSGEGIEELLRVSGGLGVADFACVGDVVTAMANLPSGGTTNVTVNGKPVTLSGREIVLSFAGGSVDVSGETDGFFFSAVPNGGETALFTTGYRSGGLFALFAAGTRDDFFGFRKEHRYVRQSGVTAGHENLFLALTEQVSDGGSTITGATGKSLTVTAQKTVALTADTAFTMAATADRFLGGEASIPLGMMTLDEGAWEPRLSLATVTEILPAVLFRMRGEVTDDEGYTLSAGLRLTF